MSSDNSPAVQADLHTYRIYYLEWDGDTKTTGECDMVAASKEAAFRSFHSKWPDRNFMGCERL